MVSEPDPYEPVGQQHAPIGDDAAEWDERYGEADRVWSGRPNKTLVAEVETLPPGRALDVGCGEGADAVWLAGRGWDVTALDPSRVALQRAGEHAQQAGVDVRWLHAGFLEAALPEAGFDLVSAQYPVLRKRADQAAERTLLTAVAPGGILLVVHHVVDWITRAATASTRPSGSDRPTSRRCSGRTGRSNSTRAGRGTSRRAPVPTTSTTWCFARDGCAETTWRLLGRTLANGPRRRDTARMVYDRRLAERLRVMLSEEPDISEKAMFGGLGFLVGGRLAVSAGSGGDLMVRVDPDQSEALVTETPARRFVMRGREMRGWLQLDEAAIAADVDLRRWVDLGWEYARSRQGT